MIPTGWKRPGTRSLIHSAAAAEITEQNKWMILQMRAAQRQVTATTSQHYWQRKRRRSAEHTACWSRERDRTKWKAEQIKESSRTRRYKLCAHTGHVTFVPLTFASGDNEPACLFSTSLVRSSFFPAKQRLLWSWWSTNEERLSGGEKKKINGPYWRKIKRF